MNRLIGFKFNSGEIVDEKTGEVRPWTNYTLRVVTDEGLQPNEFGLVVGEQKLKTLYVAQSLDLDPKSHPGQINNALSGLLNRQIEFKISLTKDGVVPTGFIVVSSPK